jgi:hypothetical protein
MDREQREQFRRERDRGSEYVPSDGRAQHSCSFCGHEQGDMRRLINSGDGSVAICEDCVSSFALYFADHPRS